jgi:FtsZ-binding cell division protein ZapB
LKYLEAKNDYSQAIDQDVIDVDTIEALKIEIDRLKVFKPTTSNILLSVGQVRNKIELFIKTNDVPRAKVLATNMDINGLRAFKEVIAELKKQVDELSPKSDSFIREVGRSLYLLY